MTPEEISIMIEEVNDASASGLNQWELSFMNSITDQWDRNQHLTELQIDKLTVIHKRYVK